MGRGRDRLSSIDLLPEECEPVVAWATTELSQNKRTQVDIYGEFKTKLIALQGESGVDFDIPGFSSFNRFSLRLARLHRRLERAREIATTLSDRFDAAGSEDLTLIAGEAIKSLILETLEMSDEGKISTKGAMELAGALRSVAAAQASSSNRRIKLDAEANARKVEAEMKDKANQALDRLASEPGISKEAIARARREFLGVRPKKKDAGEGKSNSDG